MNYKTIYFNLISKAKFENRKRYEKTDSRYIYYEKHHINPKSLGGEDDKDNLVLLTAKEHYIAHKILIEFTEGLDKRNMVFALHKMSYGKTNKHIKCARDYDYVNKLQSIINKGENHPNFGKKRSNESKQKMSKSQLGRIRSKEEKKAISEGLKKTYENGDRLPYKKGLNRDDKEKESISRGLKKVYENGNRIPYWKNKKMTDQTKQKMRESHKNKIWINNGINHKVINKDDNIPAGWIIGMLKRKWKKD